MTAAVRLLVLALLLSLTGACADRTAAMPRTHPPSPGPTAPATSPYPGCPPRGATGSAVDYVDFVRFGGRTYLATGIPRPISVLPAELGIPKAKVRCELSRIEPASSYAAKDGDASFLPRGTVIYAIRGYAPIFRVAARHGHGYLVYEVDTAPQARKGEDLLDIRGRVLHMEVLGGASGTTVLARIDNPQQIQTLVGEVLAAPVNQHRTPTSAPLALRFDLADGTAVQRAWFPKENLLERGIELPPSFGTTMRRLLGSG